MLNLNSKFCLLTLSTLLILTPETSTAWPPETTVSPLSLDIPRPQDADIVAVMDAEYNITDLAGFDDLSWTSYDASLRTDIKGPFGEARSSWGITHEGERMCDYYQYQMSHTIAVYFYTPATVELGPILQRDDYYASFSVHYNKSDLDFKALGYRYSVENITVVQDFLVPNSWNFIAFTDDGHNLKLYNEKGYVLETLPSFLEFQDFGDYLRLGYYYDSSTSYVHMKKTDAFACLYVYHAVLSGEEISQIPLSCNYKTTPVSTKYTSSARPTEMTTATNPHHEIPRPQNADIVAVMNEQFGLADLAGSDDFRYTNPYAEVRTDIKGPFGEVRSSWGISREYREMCKYYQYGISRTIAFYFYSPANEIGPMLWRCDSYSYIGFGVNYNNTDLEFKGLSYYYDNITVVTDFLVPYSWNFIAFTDDGNSLKLYNEYGYVLETLPSFLEFPDYYEYIRLGYYYDSSSGYVYMKETDAFACLYVYDAVLSGEEISQIPLSCKFPPFSTTEAPTPFPTTAVKTTESSTRYIETARPMTTTAAPLPTTATKSTMDTTLTSSTLTPDENVWPHQEHLVGVWPLSSMYGSADISGNELEPSQPSGVHAFTIGPHGNDNTAVVATKASSELLKIEGTNLAPSDGSFTIAMWFSPKSGKTSGDLFEFLDELGSSRSFQFHYSGSNIDISANRILTGRFPMVQPNGAWTFVAVTLENNEKLTVFGDHGMVGQLLKCSACSNSMEFNTGGMALGHAARWGNYFQVGDVVSCFAMYSTALNDAELSQLKDGCRIVNYVALSGQPRLPLSPIPDVNHPGSPKIPSNGQFPWLGSLQYKGKHICSATIVNSRWILTSATCVVEDPTTTYLYRFTAATYDLELAYDHQQQRDVRAISLSGNSSHDLALLQLSQALTMTSDYINDAYIAQGGEKYVNWQKQQLVVGWGDNGRTEFDSPTLPRYVVGEVLSDSQCEKLWSEEYNSTYDYCFGTLIEVHDVPCHGDEGSPLLVQTDGNVDAGMGERLLQVGVYHGRDAECSMLKPALFTQTAPFAEWIASVVDRV